MAINLPEYITIDDYNTAFNQNIKIDQNDERFNFINTLIKWASVRIDQISNGAIEAKGGIQSNNFTAKEKQEIQKATLFQVNYWENGKWNLSIISKGISTGGFSINQGTRGEPDYIPAIVRQCLENISLFKANKYMPYSDSHKHKLSKEDQLDKYSILKQFVKQVNFFSKTLLVIKDTNKGQDGQNSDGLPNLQIELDPQTLLSVVFQEILISSTKPANNVFVSNVNNKYNPASEYSLYFNNNNAPWKTTPFTINNTPQNITIFSEGENNLNGKITGNHDPQNSTITFTLSDFESVDFSTWQPTSLTDATGFQSTKQFQTFYKYLNETLNNNIPKIANNTQDIQQNGDDITTILAAISNTIIKTETNYANSIVATAPDSKTRIYQFPFTNKPNLNDSGIIKLKVSDTGNDDIFLNYKIGSKIFGGKIGTVDTNTEAQISGNDLIITNTVQSGNFDGAIKERLSYVVNTANSVPIDPSKFMNINNSNLNMGATGSQIIVANNTGKGASLLPAPTSNCVLVCKSVDSNGKAIFEWVPKKQDITNTLDKDDFTFYINANTKTLGKIAIYIFGAFQDGTKPAFDSSICQTIDFDLFTNSNIPFFDLFPDIQTEKYYMAVSKNDSQVQIKLMASANSQIKIEDVYNAKIIQYIS